MDGLSIAVSVAGLVTLRTQMLNSLQEFISDAAAYQNEFGKIVTELRCLVCLLGALQQETQKLEAAGMDFNNSCTPALGLTYPS